MNKEYLAAKPSDFQTIINDIFSEHKSSPLVIALEGDLGAGKTTFTQELGDYLGVSEVITSPTFTIMKQYELTSDDFDKLVHIDAYRIESETELKPLRLEGTFLRPGTIICVEWPELISSIIPETAIQINIKISADETRLVTVKYPQVKK